LLFGVLYTVVVNFGKILGCGIPSLFCGFNVRGALRIGCGMLPRGEVTLIIAGIGLGTGLLSPEIFGVVVLMLLATAVVAPPVLVRAFRNPASGLRKDVREVGSEPLVFGFPSAETAELLVSKLIPAFESEGYFVHELSHRKRIYQLRKDDVVIGFQHRETDVIFDCNRSEIPFVNTAMYEVLVDLERTIRELKKPVDSAAIRRRIMEPVPGTGSRTNLAGYISKEMLQPALKGEDKREVIDELLRMLQRNGLIHDMDEARRAVWSREQSMSTGMEHGIAIPHGRTDAVDRLVCAVGLKPSGIDFGSFDGEPSTVFVLTLAPKHGTSPHVQFMSIVSQVLSRKGMKWILACESAEEMYAVLTGTGLTPRKGIAGVRTHAAGVGRKKRAGLLQYLRSDCVAVELSGTTKDQLIDELLQMLDRHGVVKDVKDARAAILERERVMPTGIEHGVAIPHARTNAVNKLVCAIGTTRHGINFGASDSEPSRIIVLTLSPAEASTPHVQFMAMIARMLNAEGRERVLSARSREDLWRTLVELT